MGVPVRSIPRSAVLGALLVCLAAPPLRADFETGLKAYQSGDYAGAIREWQPLAEKGDANAQYNMGLLYALGQGMPRDYGKAAEWYRKAAGQGVAAAEYNLGVIYANGQGVPQNITEARQWFLKAAAQEVPEAEDSLGYLYDAGQGVPKDYAEAERWYRKAAESGVASAQFNLGVMYDLGEGVERNYDEAAKWYRKAAEQGYSGAMANLGILYYNAQGVPRDLVESYAWLKRANEAGDPRAPQLLHIVESRLKPEELGKARELAANWRPKGPQNVRDANRLFARLKPAAMGSADPDTPARSAAPGPAPLIHEPAKRAEWTGVERVVAVGDVHGDFEQLVLVLESAGLIDSQGNWIGRRTHLVQIGDVVDGGPDSRKVMDLLMRLEGQAAAAGGHVHCLIGDHEAMNVYGDLRYVSPAEFAAFRNDNSEATRNASYRAKPDMDRNHWERENPPGLAELRQAFAPSGKYGAWITSHNTIIKIDDTLFVHAGLSPKYEGWNLERINNEVRRELTHLGDLHGGMVGDEQGPLRYTGLARGDETRLAPLVDRIERDFGVKRVVMGHTFANGAIVPRFGGKVILIDVGLSRIYDNAGRLGCLLIENDKAYAIHRGQKLALPSDEGRDMLRYLKQAAALDPQPSPLLPRIAKLEAALAR